MTTAVPPIGTGPLWPKEKRGWPGACLFPTITSSWPWWWSCRFLRSSGSVSKPIEPWRDLRAPDPGDCGKSTCAGGPAKPPATRRTIRVPDPQFLAGQADYGRCHNLPRHAARGSDASSAPWTSAARWRGGRCSATWAIGRAVIAKNGSDDRCDHRKSQAFSTRIRIWRTRPLSR